MTCSKHFGEKSDTTALGWRALSWNEAEQRYTPAVDLLTEWTGTGNQIVVTLIVPSRDMTSRLVECLDMSRPDLAGFRARLADGTQVTYLAGAGGALAVDGVNI